jgi:surface carbohydrate biosynthesis protein
MKIGLILDNPRRDLGGIALLTYQFLKRGHEVFVIPMYDQGYDVPLLGLDVVIVNYARTSNLDFLKSYKEMGITVIVLDTEGGIFPEKGDGSPEFWAKRFRSIGASDYVDYYLFWGERTYDAFREHSGMDEARMMITGCPRYDLCHLKWRRVLHYPRSGHILINLNFPSINPWWGRAEYLKAERKILFHSAFKEISNVAKIVNVDVNRALPLEQERMRVLNEYVRVIDEIAARNPEKNFIVRPHPFENMEIYKEVFADRLNVTVDSFGEVTHVISHAEFVIHLNCSTSVETRLLGKLPVSLEFLNSDLLRVNIRLPSQISYPVRSLEELDAVIKNQNRDANDQLTDENVHDYVRPWFFECDGKAGERVASVVSEIARPRADIERKRNYWMSLRSCYAKAKPKHLIQGVANQLLGSYVLTRMRMLLHGLRRMKYVRAETIERRIQELAGCEGTKMQFAVVYAPHPATGMRMATIRAFCVT